ncbi:MAG: hypothetical protein RLZZ65_1127 [Bacteroidota bacterium]|jgi:UDPglucose--hexose-1-phosphate uridylyltransferase
MTDLNLTLNPHRRYNPLLDEWVLVSPQRNLRPWQGQNEAQELESRPSHDPNCYLCAGNPRSGGQMNPAYTSCFVFDNDFPALDMRPEVLNSENEHSASDNGNPGSFFKVKSAKGINRVVCYSPRHNLTMSGLSVKELEAVVFTWKAQFEELSALPFIDYVQIFENKGAVMGCSNPHPHGQIWAGQGLPTLVARTQAQLKKYYLSEQAPLLQHYLLDELQNKQRVVYENKNFVVLVPFWAVWPFETLILPKQNLKNISEFTSDITTDFAVALSKITRAYDAVFSCDFPYSAGFHQAPSDGEAHPEWTLHFHFYPPLLRSASIKKFQVGYEMLAEAQRDMTPEQSAMILRGLIV